MGWLQRRRARRNLAEWAARQAEIEREIQRRVDERWDNVLWLRGSE